MRPRVRRTIALVVGALLLVFFLPSFVNLGRYRLRIASAISAAVGRPVYVGNVSFRLLPEPGFDLTNVSIDDDPAFSAEPVVHADDVVAVLRLTSIWRGRLEIAKLSFTDVSVNLVRRSDGAWNIETLMSRAAQTPSAPTAALRPEIRPRFPYISASRARLNFKTGVEKRVWTLGDADLSFWQASENEWAARLEAVPLRTDSNLSDTGRILAEGRIRRD